MKWRAHIVMDLDLDLALADGTLFAPPTPEEIQEQIARCDSPQFAWDIEDGLSELEDASVKFTVVKTERID